MNQVLLARAFRSGEISIKNYLSQVERDFLAYEPNVLAFLPELNRFDRLQKEAEDLLAQYPDPDTRPFLFGILVGVKDIFHADGFTTQAGCRLPADELQGRQAESVTKLKKAGALIMGKTVTTEFAYFTPGATRNPHNPAHTPGGSSSGSAAAVGAGMCQLAVGTQTIGSIIRPASFCGAFGMKPTYDRISRSGVIPLSTSLDHIGFFAASLDIALHAARALYNDWDEPTIPMRKPVLGIPDGAYLQNLSDEGRLHFEIICKALSATYRVHRVPIMEDFQAIRDRHDLIMSAEAARVHESWFQKYESLYSPKFIELIKRGQNITDDQLHNALTVRDNFRSELRRAMIDHNIDAWICPSTVGAAPKGLESAGDPVMNLPWTQAGLPAINLPAGKNPLGLPMGLQVVANWHKDESLLLWASDIEEALENL